MDLSNGYIDIQDTLNNSPSKSTYGKEGEVYLKRVGNQYTTWFRAAGDTVFYNNANYPKGDLTMTMGVVAMQVTNPVKRATVQIDAVEVRNANNRLITDPLNTNSIRYY